MDDQAVPDKNDTNYRSPVLDRAGAVDAPEGSPDAGVPMHFGDPFGEQRAATTGPVIIDRSHRDVITIGGGERLTWLEGFVSQHVAELADGTGAETLILDANGRVEHHAVLSDTDGQVVVDTESGRGEPLLSFLSKMVFWADAAPAAAELGVLTLAGTPLPDAIDAPGGRRVTLPGPEAYASVPLPGGGVARRMPWPATGAIDLVVPRTDLSAWFDAAVAAGARPAGSWAFEALRVADTTPTRARLGVDTDEKTIPHEVPTWIGAAVERGAVHLEKGCYRGQETVSRVHNLGRSPRVLVRLHLDGSGGELPPPGAELTSGGRTVGRVGTVVHHHEDGPVALALLKRAVKADTPLEVGGVAAAVDPDSAPEETGPQAGREAVRRLRGQA